MSAVVIVAIILGVFFVFGLMAGVIIMIAWPLSRARRWDRLSGPSDEPGYRPDLELDDENDKPGEPPRWPANRG